MSGLVLRLAGPMQSWGERSTFAAERDTAGFPTRSGLIGLFAASMGIERGQAGVSQGTRPIAIADFAALRITVRVDAPGLLLTDFHTVGGGLPSARTVPTAEGKHRAGENTATIVSRRHYLSDAVFTVAVTAVDDDDLIMRIGDALLHPVWQPYLGRRSCPPDQPLVLRRRCADPEAELRTQVPLPRRPWLPRAADGGVEVDLLTESVPADGRTAVTELSDVPLSFDRFDRRYARRTVYRQSISLPTRLLHKPGEEFQRALYAYIEQGRVAA